MNKVYNKIESIVGNVITVKASGVRYNELAQISTRFGKSLAQVNKIDGEVVSLQVFAGGQGISTGDEVRFLGHGVELAVSKNMLGRVFNGMGELGGIIIGVGFFLAFEMVICTGIIISKINTSKDK